MNHGFYLKYGAGLESPDGCDEMIAALKMTSRKDVAWLRDRGGVADALLQWFNKPEMRLTSVCLTSAPADAKEVDCTRTASARS